MRITQAVGFLGLVLGLWACATPYRESNFLVEMFTVPGGYSDEEIRTGVWHVAFASNGITREETLQTYWLYRCAELTMEKGYAGFQILSSNALVAVPPEQLGPSGEPAPLAAGRVIFVPVYGGSSGPTQRFQGDIQLLNRPFTPMPGKIFDAAALKATLDPYVNGKKCGAGNVCHHVHDYLYARPEDMPPGAPQAGAATGSPGPQPNASATAPNGIGAVR